MKPVPYFIKHGWSDFWIKCSERFPKVWGKFKLSLPEIPSTCFPEQGFNHVLHMRKKYRNCLDMNKTERNAKRLELINLQPALKNNFKIKSQSPGLQ